MTRGSLKDDKRVYRPYTRGEKLHVVLHRHQARIGFVILHLTELEWQVLVAAARENGDILSYAEMWRKIWQMSGNFTRREQETVRGVIKRLRRKVERDPANPKFLFVIRGLGIRLEPAHLEIE